MALLPGPAFACSCKTPTLESRYAASENVFTALMTGGEVTDERVGNSPKLSMYFEVTEIFKGTVPFEHFSGHAGGGTCGISLQIGIEYLFFAPDTGEVGLCSGILPVSGVADRAALAGSRYLDALRDFKSGKNDDLAEPWQFFERDGICTLSSRFPYGDRGSPAGLRVMYGTRMPDSVVSDADEAQARTAFSEMTVSVPGRYDLKGYPLTLEVGDRQYTARWQEVQYSAARYFVDANEVTDLVTKLIDATELRMASAHPTYGDVSAAASTVNAGDSIARMAACMTGHSQPPAE